MEHDDHADDHSAFDDLFAVEYPAMVRTAYLIVGDDGLARELAQESFTRMLARWRRLRTYERPGAWLRTVTVRNAVRVRDRRVREDGDLRAIGRLAATDPDPDEVEDRRSERAELVEAVLQLPRQQRAAIVLHHLDGLGIDEVAEVLGIAPSTVRVHLHRARHRLAELLGDGTTEEVSDVH